MELDSLPLTEVILNPTLATLGYRCLDRNLQPGSYLEFEGQTYLILERKHRYVLKSGRYHLHKISVYVQKAHSPTDRSLFDDRWIIGDITCAYNARSELLRCAVNPIGPCELCTHYQPSEER